MHVYIYNVMYNLLLMHDFGKEKLSTQIHI
jgi:hypothetical protein